jgi:hypothetical protein
MEGLLENMNDHHFIKRHPKDLGLQFIVFYIKKHFEYYKDQKQYKNVIISLSRPLYLLLNIF